MNNDNKSTETLAPGSPPLDSSSVDEIKPAGNERLPVGISAFCLFLICVVYISFHLYALNIQPIETWTFRIVHISVGLLVGFLLLGASNRFDEPKHTSTWVRGIGAICLVLSLCVAAMVAVLWLSPHYPTFLNAAELAQNFLGGIAASTLVISLLASYTCVGERGRLSIIDASLGILALAAGAYIVLSLERWRMVAGTPFAGELDFYMSAVGIILILELTRRVAGLALVAITGVFMLYAFIGPWLPGIFEHSGYSPGRFFTYIYTDNGVLGPTIAVSSTYIVLFITFAAFLQKSHVGEYFVNFAFSVAGRSKGGPAKVAVFASGLMGMINGTSAGNVVSTGSLTIPLMRRVGYEARSAGSIEAAASTGGQIAPPIMGAGAFIMAEVTGIPYTDIAVAAIIPAVLYFLSIYFMVDLEAERKGMRGLRSEELPKLRSLLKQAYLFFPVIILIATLFMGYSVIRAGTLALIAAAVVSWLTPHWMGPRAILSALALSARMVIPLVAVCACAGIVVGVIAMTGVGARFASLLLGIADNSQFLALLFAMLISILLGMGMPTTAAYAVAASVIAPGLQDIGIPPLVAHFFVFYYAVISAITPPVALASYAAAAIAGSDPLKTSITSFKFGLAAFVVPFLFYYSPAILMQGDDWLQIARILITGSFGIYLLAASVQAWCFGPLNLMMRGAALAAGLAMMAGGVATDLVGIAVAVIVIGSQLKLRRHNATI
ncbi:C4-dicarboxylate ABC transporter permease [Halomonas campaniensis]|uniref:C4-dicarboxylate ABC transporter permease n=2 Tax=Halomonas campaniensis TaxID=213554 RepID=A0A246S3Y5_9GAMM|nr:TRAP transporter permease [Halomonas campaniensis]OWV31166.1 C4-dicarboxylate ABC transporter permease [Halomonas campaniensis]